MSKAPLTPLMSIGAHLEQIVSIRTAMFRSENGQLRQQLEMFKQESIDIKTDRRRIIDHWQQLSDDYTIIYQCCCATAAEYGLTSPQKSLHVFQPPEEHSSSSSSKNQDDDSSTTIDDHTTTTTAAAASTQTPLTALTISATDEDSSIVKAHITSIKQEGTDISHYKFPPHNGGIRGMSNIGVIGPILALPRFINLPSRRIANNDTNNNVDSVIENSNDSKLPPPPHASMSCKSESQCDENEATLSDDPMPPLGESILNGSAPIIDDLQSNTNITVNNEAIIWSKKSQIKKLKKYVKKYGNGNWHKVASHLRKHMPLATAQICQNKWNEIHPSSSSSSASLPSSLPFPIPLSLPLFTIPTSTVASPSSSHSSSSSSSDTHRCSLCGRNFKSKSGLKNHSYTHTNEYPLSCQHCGKGLVHKSDLERHLRKHTGEKPFACNVCSKAFDRKSSLTIHYRVHSGDRPYKCSYTGCDKAFTNSGNLTRHIRIHTGEKPYSCQLCELNFSDPSALNAHMHTNKHGGKSKSLPAK